MWDNILQWFSIFQKQYLWLFSIGIIFVVAIILNIIQHVVYNRLMPRLKRSHRLWDDAFIASLHHPLYVLVWLLAVIYAGQVVQLAHPEWTFLAALNSIRRIGVVILVVWFAVRFMRQLSYRVSHADYSKIHLNRMTVEAITKLLTLVIWIFALLVILQEVGVKLTAVVAFIGGGAVVIGFAAKDLLANFFGGLVVFTDRPFSVGDWIASPDKNIEGTVEEIGWRSTRIRTFDKQLLCVPNSLFSNIIIRNPSCMTHRRINKIIGLRYCDLKVADAVCKDIEAMLRKREDVDQNQSLFVRLIEFADSSINLQVYALIKDTAWVSFLTIQHDVFLEISNIVEKHGADIAFPTRTLDASNPIPVHVESNPTSTSAS